MQHFKKRYLEALSQQRKEGELRPTVTMISTKKRGRSLLLGNLDAQVQGYIRVLCDVGAPVSAQIVQAAAEGITVSLDRTLLVENGGHIALSRGWALLLLHKMGYVKRKGTTVNHENIA